MDSLDTPAFDDDTPTGESTDDAELGRGGIDSRDPNVIGDLVRAIEAIVLVATDPVEPSLMAQLLEIPVEMVESLCVGLADAYEDAGHGFQLARAPVFLTDPKVRAPLSRTTVLSFSP